jgi:uncharacterized membrane protein YkvA (DUF1232 family)
VPSPDIPAVLAGFWDKVRRNLHRVPFLADAIAAYYCAIDPATPLHVKATLVGALAYFVTPVDLIPDVIVGVGFSDDATVLAMAIAAIARHLRPEHRRKAWEALDKLRAG